MARLCHIYSCIRLECSTFPSTLGRKQIDFSLLHDCTVNPVGSTSWRPGGCSCLFCLFVASPVCLIVSETRRAALDRPCLSIVLSLAVGVSSTLAVVKGSTAPGYDTDCGACQCVCDQAFQAGPIISGCDRMGHGYMVPALGRGWGPPPTGVSTTLVR